MTTKALSVLQI